MARETLDSVLPPSSMLGNPRAPKWYSIPGLAYNTTQVMPVRSPGVNAGCLVKYLITSQDENWEISVSITFVPGATLEMFGILEEK